jgi:hypothetical protein
MGILSRWRREKNSTPFSLSLFLGKQTSALELRPALVVDVEARKTGLLVRGWNEKNEKESVSRKKQNC